MKTYKRIIKITINDQPIRYLNHSIILKDEPKNTIETFNNPLDFSNYFFKNGLSNCYFHSNRKGEIKKIIFYNFSDGSSKSCKPNDTINGKVETEYISYQMPLKELSEYPDSTLAIQYIKQEYNKTVDEIIMEMN